MGEDGFSVRILTRETLTSELGQLFTFRRVGESICHLLQFYGSFSNLKNSHQIQRSKLENKSQVILKYYYKLYAIKNPNTSVRSIANSFPHFTLGSEDVASNRPPAT
jgi:hypothetical protein